MVYQVIKKGGEETVKSIVQWLGDEVRIEAAEGWRIFFYEGLSEVARRCYRRCQKLRMIWIFEERRRGRCCLFLCLK